MHFGAVCRLGWSYAHLQLTCVIGWIMYNYPSAIGSFVGLKIMHKMYIYSMKEAEAVIFYQRVNGIARISTLV